MDKKAILNEIIDEYADGKPSVFAKIIGVAPSTISSWLSRNTFDYDILFAKCEMISAEYLLSGSGPMKKNSDHPISNQTDSRGSDPTIEKLLAQITDQAIEIGALREQIRQLKREKGKNVSDAQTSGIADAV